VEKIKKVVHAIVGQPMHSSENYVEGLIVKRITVPTVLIEFEDGTTLEINARSSTSFDMVEN